MFPNKLLQTHLLPAIYKLDHCFITAEKMCAVLI